MSYVHYTANPKNETNDCIIRSIACATNRPWQDVMREMCDIAIEKYLMPNDGAVVDEYMYRRKIFVYSPTNEITVAEFAKQNPTGRYVICVKDHGLSIVDGDYYDLTDSGKEKVIDYYEVKEGI